jgi:hypothetical protein
MVAREAKDNIFKMLRLIGNASNVQVQERNEGAHISSNHMAAYNFSFHQTTLQSFEKQSIPFSTSKEVEGISPLKLHNPSPHLLSLSNIPSYAPAVFPLSQVKLRLANRYHML